jgi:phosphatidylglycerophosphate synthase
MTWSQLRASCKRQSDYIITLLFTNEIALLLTWVLMKTRVTPNQVTVASVVSAFLCGCFYAMGWFLPGSAMLFISHVLDCTDGNLARAKQRFSPLGKWLDAVGDRMGETFLFLGVGAYFIQGEGSGHWALLAVLDGLLLMLYYYMVDISLALGISKPKQELSTMVLKGVHVKWGLLEPVIY